MAPLANPHLDSFLHLLPWPLGGGANNKCAIACPTCVSKSINNLFGFGSEVKEMVKQTN